MKYSETKISKFFKARGFYLVLAGCLVAMGFAAVAAWNGFSSPDTANKDDNNSSIVSKPDTDVVQNETQSEPYSSTDNSSEEEPIEQTRPVVAENFIYPLSGDVQKAYSDDQLVYSATFGDMRLHAGLDIKCEKGSSVGACGNGVVVAVVEDEKL